MFKSISSFSGLLLLSVTSLVLSSCGGGGGGGNDGSVSTGGVYFSHADLAREFVDRMYTDVGADLELEKIYTLQDDYIVVWDNDFPGWDAYYIGDYNVGENLSRYLDDYDYSFYYDLDFEGGNLYRHAPTGRLFEKTPIVKDHMKLAAIKEELEIQTFADQVSETYGLSANRSREFASIVKLWETTGKKRSMTDSEHDEFTRMMVGSSISEIKSVAMSAESSEDPAVVSLIEKAAKTNGIGPEQAASILGDFLQ